MSKFFAVVVFAISVVVGGNAFADPLPKGAVKMASAEVRALYAGKSGIWDKNRGYFAPDGSYSTYANDKSYFGEGRWSVTGNKVCVKSDFVGVKDGKVNSKIGPFCWTYYKAGKKIWSEYTDHKGKNHGWWDKELTKLTKGDKVTKTAAALKAKAQAVAGN